MMRSHYWIALGLLIVSLVLGYTVFSASALPKLWHMSLKLESLNSSIAILHKKIADISEEVQLLSQRSPRAYAFIGEIAREELGMIGPGEVLFKVDGHHTKEERTQTHEKNLHP